MNFNIYNNFQVLKVLPFAFFLLLPVSTYAQTPVERVTTIAPFPRGLAMVDGKLYVLCRGRVRNAGGVSAEIQDQAGTIYVVDPDIAESIDTSTVSKAIRENGKLFTTATDPPFELWDRSADPPESDRETDRPYCTLRYHKQTQSFYICAFSGIDKPKRPGDPSFSKNLNDAVLRYDLRTNSWHEIERHNIEAGGLYPHHDPAISPPPHGYLNGPDNCLTIGNNLYVVAKDNSLLVRYDLTKLVTDPHAGHPQGEQIMDETIFVRGKGVMRFYGQSALAVYDNYLYIAYRTSSIILRIPIDDDGFVLTPIIADVVAKFQPYDPVTMKSANITDMTFDSDGRLYVVSAMPARVYRFIPDAQNIYDATDPSAKPWLDLAQATSNPALKAENILIDKTNRLFITTGNGYEFQKGALGTVYRVKIND